MEMVCVYLISTVSHREEPDWSLLAARNRSVRWKTSVQQDQLYRFFYFFPVSIFRCLLLLPSQIIKKSFRRVIFGVGCWQFWVFGKSEEILWCLLLKAQQNKSSWLHPVNWHVTCRGYWTELSVLYFLESNFFCDSVDCACILLCIIKAFVLVISYRTCNSKMWTHLKQRSKRDFTTDQEIVLVATCLYLCLSFGMLVPQVGFAGVLLLKKNLACVVDIFRRHCCMATSTHSPGIVLIRVHSVFLDRQTWWFRACSLIVIKKCLNWPYGVIPTCWVPPGGGRRETLPNCRSTLVFTVITESPWCSQWGIYLW